MATQEAAEQGRVKWYSIAKGYGFIVREEDGEDIFVHHSAILDEEDGVLWEGDRVRFEVEDGPKGLKARNVVRR